jgi:flagellin
MSQLSSGSRINKAADDAAGLAISEGMKTQIRAAVQARRNANDGISMLNTAEGSLNEISSITTRIRELGIQAASDTIGDRERGYIDLEVQQLKSEIDRVANTANWNSTKLLDGTTPSFDFQIGTNATEYDYITFDTSNNGATLEALGLSTIDYTTKEGARASLEMLENAQTQVNAMRAEYGSLQNRLYSAIETLSITEENLAASNSRIRDTDIAATSAEMARNNVLLQAGTATLAQANQNGMLALKLLG